MERCMGPTDATASGVGNEMSDMEYNRQCE